MDVDITDRVIEYRHIQPGQFIVGELTLTIGGIMRRALVVTCRFQGATYWDVMFPIPFPTKIAQYLTRIDYRRTLIADWKALRMFALWVKTPPIVCSLIRRS